MHDDWDDRREAFLLAAMERSRFAVCAADLQIEDQPLMFVNDAFETLTGYSSEETIGKNCRFLQGPDTDPKTVRAIRAAIEAGEDSYFEILNYKKDGTAFWNGLHIGPVGYGDEPPFLFFGYQRDVTAEVEAREHKDMLVRELRHRLGNLMAIVGMIVRTSKGDEQDGSLRKVLEGRIQALTASNELVFPLLWDRSEEGDTDREGRQPIALTTVIRTVLEPIDDAERIVVSGDETVILSDRAVTNVALAIHELATNAVKYGALSGEIGEIEVFWHVEEDRILIDWVEEGLADPETALPSEDAPTRQGMGTRLLRSIAQSARRGDKGLVQENGQLTYRFEAQRAEGS